MNRTAYLVAYLYANGTYKVGIFSEPHPTHMGLVATATIDSYVAEDYGAAERRLRRDTALKRPWLRVETCGGYQTP